MTTPRHGTDWGRSGPLPVQSSDVIGKRAPVGESPSNKAIPIRAINLFIQSLPPNLLQFLTETGQVAVSTATLVPGNTITLIQATVPDKAVWVTNSVQFYGLAPSSQLAAPQIPLRAEQLAGLVRFEVFVNGRQPMQTHQSVNNPYAAASAAPLTGSGWPFVEVPPSSQAEVFALYARGNQVVQATAHIDVVPLFWLSALGARLTGFTLSELLFDDFLRTL